MADLSAISDATRTTLLALAQAKRTLKISAERLQAGLRILSPIEGVAAFFDASELSARALRLFALKDKITEAATITGGTVTVLDSIITAVNLLRTKALALTAPTLVATTVVGDVVNDVTAKVTDALGGAKNNDSFDITYNGTTTTIVNDNNDTFTILAAEISAIDGLTATVSDGNAFTITAADGNDVTIANNNNELATDMGLASSTNGTLGDFVTNETAESEYDAIRLTLNTLAGGATYHGVNLVSINPDDLEVTFNEDGSSSITIAGTASDATGLGLTITDSANSFATQQGIDAIVAELDAALVTLAATKAGLTAFDAVFDTRLNFTNALIDLLNEGADKLVGVNLDEEQALALATQTRHDLTLSGIQILLSDTALISLLNVRLNSL